MTDRLGRLITDQGERSVVDAVSQCSRCGYCEQACPTYLATGREAFSGRGRNQVVRMLLEGQLSSAQSAAEALSTCLLCGACTDACYAHVRTADLVLEGRRMLAGGRVPRAMRLVAWMMERHARAFERLLHAVFALKRWGVALALCRLRLPELLGLPLIAEMERHAPDVPSLFLSECFTSHSKTLSPKGSGGSPGDAAWLYFAACGPNYLYPQVGLSTVAALRKGSGPGAFMENSCCGLLSYNYGSLESARRFARLNIERWEKKSGGAGTIAVGDCSSCVAHLKSYPQLFLEEPDWKARAERFSSRVRDYIELPMPRARRLPVAGIATYHDSCRARNGEVIVEQPRARMRELFGDAFVELPEPSGCCGGAGAFAFTQPELSEDILRRKIRNIASTRARWVVTSSTSCLLQLARGLKKYYPECRVLHLSELEARAWADDNI